MEDQTNSDVLAALQAVSKANASLVAQLTPKEEKATGISDALSKISPLVSALLVFLVGVLGWIASDWFNHQQIRLNELEAFQKVLPLLEGDEQKQKLGLLALATLGNERLAVRLATLNRNVSAMTTLLLDSARSDDLELAQMLVRAGVKTMMPNEEGLTPLMAASMSNSIHVMDILLTSSSTPRMSTSYFLCNSPLVCAIQFDHLEAAKKLIAAGAMPEDKAVVLAVKKHSVTMLHLLLSSGGKPNKSISWDEGLDAPR